ncbi:MAG: twin-arginine translocase TatA/TatE family subunit [Deltaproteobacteria bacterium CG11_big_fil_rev_8_21_14_0_20_47_16]|nr:MAG: twin-arginine translocase TatA/TatE family subunit [Deltaproteobacteria bacterium CG11_big_fil_rev_8_21_14_0_20_47_16]
MGRFQFSDIAILLVLGILLFGAKRLPELAKAFGKSITEFKRGMNNLSDDIKSGNQDKDLPPKA